MSLYVQAMIDVSLMNSPFYLLQGKHKDLYRNSLRFLGCTDIGDMSQEQAQHTFFLSLTVLLGDKVFNFRELLAHKVLDSRRMNGTPSSAEMLQSLEL